MDRFRMFFASAVLALSLITLSTSAQEASEQEIEAKKVREAISGKSFKCETLKGQLAGDVSYLDIVGDGTLRQETLAGPNGAGRSDGNWKVVPGRIKRAIMIKEYFAWPGKWEMPIELIDDGFQMFTATGGSKEIWKVCKFR